MEENENFLIPCGFENKYGEHNCWINSIVQMFFHSKHIKENVAIF